MPSPQYPHVPAAIPGRLAVDSRFCGQRIGEHSFLEAMTKVLEQSSTIATYALIVHAKNEVRSAYNRAQRLSERQETMQARADYLNQLRMTVVRPNPGVALDGKAA